MTITPLNQVFGNEAFRAHEQVISCADKASGLKAIIAIHSTALGPALGGTRMYPYESEAAALRDVLRLSEGMTYKNALAGLSFGGAKAVIIGDPRVDKSSALLEAFGAHVERLAGRFITAEDVGIGTADVEVMRTRTSHVRGIAEGGPGDPSPSTAFGVYRGLRAAAAHSLGSVGLGGVGVCVQGLGAVGMALCELLHEAGARLTVADIRGQRVDEAVRRFGARAVDAGEAHAADVDVFAPCALGAVLNQRSIPQIEACVVAGAANNQLETAEDGKRLQADGILYAPDYVLNAGGVISISHEGDDFDPDAMRRDVARIGDTLAAIFLRASAEGRPTAEVAEAMARERLARAAEASGR